MKNENLVCGKSKNVVGCFSTTIGTYNYCTSCFLRAQTCYRKVKNANFPVKKIVCKECKKKHLLTLPKDIIKALEEIKAKGWKERQSEILQKNIDRFRKIMSLQ